MDTASDALDWRGAIDGCIVTTILPIPESSDCIVLLDYAAKTNQYFENLLRVAPAKTVIWRAKYPADEHDAYVRVGWSGRQLAANTWNGYRVLLDPENGKIISSKFVK